MADFKISCPHCGQHIRCDDNYRGVQIACPACSQQFVVPKADAPPAAQESPKAPERKPLPTVPLTRQGIGHAHKLKAFSVPMLIVLNFLTLGLFPLVWMNLLHGRLPRVRPDDPSADRAVGFLFIPFYNLYWIFFSSRRLCLRLEEQRHIYGLPPRDLSKMAKITCILMVIPLVNLLAGVLVMLPFFSVKLQQSVNALAAKTAKTGPLPTRGSQFPPSGLSRKIVALLVAIGLIFFVPLTLPVYWTVKSVVQVTRCMNHERKLAAIIRNYAEKNNNNRFPNAARWCDVVKATMSDDGVFKCPDSSGSARCDYAFNRVLSGGPIARVNPKTVMLFEADYGWNANGTDVSIKPPRHRIFGKSFVIVAFADGSVHMVSASKFDQLRWNP